MQTHELVDMLQQPWLRSLQRVGVEPGIAQNAFPAMVAAYTTANRHYHTLAHVHQVLGTVGWLQRYARNLVVVELAAWFHDSVYDPKASDNEERSAAFAVATLGSLGVPFAWVDRVAKLVLSTQGHQVDLEDGDRQVLIDADLAILGANSAHYWSYARAIRQEYAWVAEADYQVGRRQVLESFLQRDRLYSTPPMLERAEATARHNLTAELRSLNPPKA